ncbi:MAG: hypothetical protein JNK45_14830 [Myxococcales bacterium]|nr:hypothetical protein [Myxococcales bacterium]
MPIDARCSTWVVAILLAATGGCRSARSSSARPDNAVPGAAAVRCPPGTTLVTAADRGTCTRPDGRPHGPVVERFPDGGLRLEGSYDAGEKHGPWRTYYDGGVLRAEAHYDHGKPTGTWVEYFADGKPATERAHRRDGAVALKTFRPGGAPLRKGVLVDGVEHGEWTDWDAAGTAVLTTWERGARVTPGSVSGTGVAACDDYVTKYRRCIADKVPEAARAQMNAAMEQSLVAWREAAAWPASDQLQTACIAAMDAARQATASMGCEW